MVTATMTEAKPGTTMRAMVQEGTGSADVLHVREISRPAATAGRVLVRVRAASVNALDWHTVHGGLLLNVISFLMRQKNDPIRGVDLAGVVQELGDGVTGLAPGDEVFGVGRGTVAEYASAPARFLVKKPASLSFSETASIGVAALTALQGLRDKAELRPGQRVLIFGAGGGVGTFAVQFAKVLGAQVTAVTGPRNLEIVRGLGPDLLIDYTREDVTRRPERYDAIFDIGATRSIGSLRRVLAPGGIFVQCGASKSGGWFGVFGRIIALVVRSRLLKQRVLMYIAHNDRADMEYVADLMTQGKVRTVIDREFPLDQAAEAIRYLGTGQARAKVVVTVS